MSEFNWVYVIYEAPYMEGPWARSFHRTAKGAYQKLRELKEDEYMEWESLRREFGLTERFEGRFYDTHRGEKADNNFYIRRRRVQE